MKALSIGGYQIILKPSMMMILGGAVFGVVGAAFLGVYPRVVDKTPAYGYLAPTTWKFECRAPAEASVSAVSTYDTYGGFDTKKEKKGGASEYMLDMESGLSVAIKQVGPTPDYIYLRDALNLEPLHARGSATLTFEAKASDVYPILFTIRDSKRLLWSQEQKVSGDWKSYSLTIPADRVERGNKWHVIFAAQLGARRGNISLRRMYLR